ncbi:MAG: Gfo/Idh/MocA family oxidoreductase [Planctomyces sp.]|nr:Gfo/Idh/MocA family oxidoreductase [Planctomyces sp.]
MGPSAEVTRRDFFKTSTVAGIAAAGVIRETLAAEAVIRSAPVIRVGLIGCGSVSGVYLPQLAKSSYAKVVSVCDRIFERAEQRATEHGVANKYRDIDSMLAGAEFDLLINTTDMQEHEAINRKAVAAGKHIWSEKPIANTLEAGQQIVADAKKKELRIWGAPVVVLSPQFEFMAKTLASGKLGRIAAAHAHYGHEGPGWSAFFYQERGGSMPDLGVYNLTSLTGLLGPVRAVTAMTSIVTPTRNIDRVGEIKVTEEDNAMVLMDHGNGVISHMQCGFNYFNPHGHGGAGESRHTIEIVGSQGYMGLVGYDWEPLGVDVATMDEPKLQRSATDADGYVWQMGANVVCECLATGKEPQFTAEHALHVVEIITAARESQRTGRRVELKSTFKWPL